MRRIIRFIQASFLATLSFSQVFAGPNAARTVAACAQASSPASRAPRLTVKVNGAQQALVLEKTQLAETKTKPTSMMSLAGDSAVSQALQSGINSATLNVASRTTSVPGGTAVQLGGGLAASVFSHRQAKTTYVWGVAGPASSNVLPVAAPVFALDFSRVLGVTPDDYAPEIVKLTPAQNTCRIVGATEGKADMRSTPAADWQIYSSFLEERVNVKPEKLAPGKYKIASPELAAGEYGVVLRPVSKSKKFVGGDVIRAQGDGLIFDSIWTFQIPDNAQ